MLKRLLIYAQSKCATVFIMVLTKQSRLEANLAKLGKPFSTFPVATALKMKPKDLINPNPEPGSVKEFHDEATDKKTVMINFAGEKFRKYPFQCGTGFMGCIVVFD